ncbi:MAG: hypothetical protein R3F48_00205 [Candidatus Zixiibacteriota bacterium]
MSNDRMAKIKPLRGKTAYTDLRKLGSEGTQKVNRALLVKRHRTVHQEKIRIGEGRVSSRLGNNMLKASNKLESEVKSRNFLAERVTEAVCHRNWTYLYQQIEENLQLAGGLPKNILQQWVEASEQCGRYDITEYLIDLFPNNHRNREWYRQTEERTHLMNTSPSHLSPSLRTPELRVIDAVRENDYLTFTKILVEEPNRYDELVNLAEDVNTTMHLAWDLGAKAKRYQKRVSIDQLERESPLSRQYVRYLFKDLISE